MTIHQRKKKRDKTEIAFEDSPQRTRTWCHKIVRKVNTETLKRLEAEKNQLKEKLG